MDSVKRIERHAGLLDGGGMWNILKQFWFSAPLFMFTLYGALAWQGVAQSFGQTENELGLEVVRVLLQSLALLAGAFFLARLLHVLVWKGVVFRRTGAPAPRLLTDLADLLIAVSSVVIIIAFVLDKPVTGLIATSGVAVAVIGFALKSMISDLFSGIAITLERPFQMGDWLETQGGAVGKVTSMTWRATGLMLESGNQLVVPNSRLSEMVLKLYDRPQKPWRDELDITFDYGITAHQVERVLLSAANDVPEVAAQANKPDVRILEFANLGVKWQLRYWVPDYLNRSRLRYAVQRNVLRNLHFSGVSTPVPSMDVRVSQQSTTQGASEAAAEFLRRVELFAPLSGGEIENLATSANTALIRTGQDVVRQGDEGNSLFIIKEGLFNVLIPDGSGGERLVASLKSGAFFGEMSLLTGALRGATVRAFTDSMVFEITKEALSPILTQRQSLMEAISTALAERQLQNRKALEQGQGTADPEEEKTTLAAQLLGKMRSFFGL
nr:MscS Mechanosensitive ion channel [uncultured bacterium]